MVYLFFIEEVIAYFVIHINISKYSKIDIMKLSKFKIIFISAFCVFLFLACAEKESKPVYRLNYDDIDFVKGESIFMSKCVICHKKDGKGFSKIFPPLSGSDFLKNDVMGSLRMVKNGSSEKIMVNGLEYKSYMPEANLSDDDLLEVFNYILNSWGNKYGSITIDDVKNVKK